MNQNYQNTSAAHKNAAFTLTELLIVVLVISVLALTAVPGYMRTVERSRTAQIDALFADTVQAQRRFRMDTGSSYATNWQLLGVDYPQMPQSAIYCLRGENRNDQTNCGNDALYKIRISGTDATNADAAVIATRINNNTFGGYQLYRFYGEDVTYCKATTEEGKAVCAKYQDGPYQDPLREPDSGLKEELKTESCGENCEIIYYSDGSKVKATFYSTGAVRTKLYYDADGKKKEALFYGLAGNIGRKDLYDPETGGWSDMILYNSNGMVDSVRTYDPQTGAMIGYTDYYPDGTLRDKRVPDPNTNKPLYSMHFWPDGKVENRIDYDPQSGTVAQELYYHNNGSIYASMQNDPETGHRVAGIKYNPDGSLAAREVYGEKNQINNIVYYDSDGRVSQVAYGDEYRGFKVHYDPAGETSMISTRLEDFSGREPAVGQVFYAPDGSVKKVECDFGACERAGYTPPALDPGKVKQYPPASAWPPAAANPGAESWPPASAWPSSSGFEKYPSLCESNPDQQQCQ